MIINLSNSAASQCFSLSFWTSRGLWSSQSRCSHVHGSHAQSHHWRCLEWLHWRVSPKLPLWGCPGLESVRWFPWGRTGATLRNDLCQRSQKPGPASSLKAGPTLSTSQSSIPICPGTHPCWGQQRRIWLPSPLGWPTRNTPWSHRPAPCSSTSRCSSY